jgi:hypothetical protein
MFPGTACRFTCVPFATRGAVETALAGVLQLGLDAATPCVFLDNDNVYPASLAAHAGAPRGAFLGYDFDDSPSEAFSFMRCEPPAAAGGAAAGDAAARDAADAARRVTDFAEKRRISDQFCTGVYGFESAAQFLQWGRHTLQHGPFPNNEIYMSSLFVNMIAAGVLVRPLHVPIVPLGTAELADAFAAAHARPLRLCFDLDGTLLTPPRVPGDWASTRPVAANAALARAARAAGHTVIIHSARGADGAGAGAALAALARFDIPFDEIIFGKPRADVYIDARSVNPFVTSVRTLGLPWGSATQASSLPNALPNNKYNSLRVVDGLLLKRGPAATLRGEIFFYEALRALPAIAGFFPRFHAAAPVPAPAPTYGGGARAGAGAAPQPPAEPLLEFSMDVVKGVPLTTLFRAQLLERYHLEAVLCALRALHGCAAVPLTLPLAALRESYALKLRARFADADVYGARADAPAVRARIERALEAHTASARFRVAHAIHGDAWFANTLLTPTNGVRLVDMRGQVGGELTLNGDATADFAKVAQSILGFDEVVFGLPRVPRAYRARLARDFVDALRAAGDDPAAVLAVCLCLIAGSLHAYAEEDVRDGLWRMVTKIIDPQGDEEWEELVGIFQ